MAISGPPRGAADSRSVGTVSRLYLGQSMPSGTVTEAQWRAFVAEAILRNYCLGQLAGIITLLKGRLPKRLVILDRAGV